MATLLIWMICGAICWAIAEGKNRDAFGWAIGGLLFGIFAIIVIALLPAKE